MIPESELKNGFYLVIDYCFERTIAEYDDGYFLLTGSDISCKYYELQDIIKRIEIDE